MSSRRPSRELAKQILFFADDKTISARQEVAVPTVLAWATQGAGGDDEMRLRALLEDSSAEFFAFDRRAKWRSAWRLWQQLRKKRPSLAIMEGTGIGGGLPLLGARLWHGVPYVISSGDAVAPFVAARHPWLLPIFALYERLLCRYAAGFIGWTPYLTGRALSFGVRRAMTAPGWAPFTLHPDDAAHHRQRIRRMLGIDDEVLVVGIVGSLAWNARVRYCYGAELAHALKRIERTDLAALIVGDGNGRKYLEDIAGGRLNRTIFLTGRVTRQAVPEYLAAMDVASLPQSIDSVGNFRYSTKLSEYLAAGLPIVTGQLPLSYDLASQWLWRLPGESPWDEEYIAALVTLFSGLSRAEIAAKRAALPLYLPDFDRQRQMASVTEFIADILRRERKKRKIEKH
jgi:glycosyltransferase involved in cell wall biosynthesis